MIAKYGEASLYNRNANGPSADNKPWIPTELPSVQETIRIAYFPMDQNNLKRLQARTNAPEVPTGAEVAYMAQVDFKPSLIDTITRLDGSLMNIFDIDTINPNGEQDILHIITVYR